MSRRPRPLRALLFLGYLLVLAEGTSLVGLKLLSRRGFVYRPLRSFVLPEVTRAAIGEIVSDRHTAAIRDDVLGWRHAPGLRTGPYVHNSQGVRSERSFEPFPAAGITRIGAFGDSFVHGTDMTNQQTWESVVERTLPGCEVLNFGTGGYGVDQAYLRYLEERDRFHPRIVLVGFMSENINRSVNVFRPFYLANEFVFPFSKPRFILEDGRLLLLPNPLRSAADYQRLLDDPSTLRMLGRDDWFYRTSYSHGFLDVLASVRLWKVWRQVRASHAIVGRDGVYTPSSQALQVTEAVIETFCREASASGSTPAVVLFPFDADIDRMRRGAPVSYGPLKARLTQAGLTVVDTADAFLPAVRGGATTAELFGASHHYSVRANEIVGAHVARSLAPLLSARGR